MGLFSKEKNLFLKTFITFVSYFNLLHITFLYQIYQKHQKKAFIATARAEKSREFRFSETP